MADAVEINVYNNYHNDVETQNNDGKDIVDQLDGSHATETIAEKIHQRFRNFLCFKWNVKELRIYGGFAPSEASPCENKQCCCNNLLSILFVFVICVYNTINVGWSLKFVISSLQKQLTHKTTDEKWCASLDINICILQIQSALLYFYGLWALRHKWIDSQITYKPISLRLWIFIVLITLLPWITGFTTVVDNENWEFGSGIISHIEEIGLYTVDIIRYWPPVAIVIILYGHLSIFADNMKEFVELRSRSVSRVVSIGDESTEYPPADFNHKEYKIAFKKMVKPFKNVLGKFSGFIVVFFICNFITMCIIFWTLVRHFFGTGCHLSFWYHFHYSTEIAYFLILWALLIYALNANYRLIVEHRYAIMYMDDLEEGKGQQRTLWYLKSIIERHSPFSIKLCGIKIPPSNRMLLVIICSVVVPTFVHVIEFAKRFYE